MDSFLLTVTPENDRPTLDAIADRFLNQGAPPEVLLLTGISSGSAAEQQQLAVSAVSSNPGLIPHPFVTYASPSATASLLLAPNPAAHGIATISVTVNDGEALATRTFAVNVNGRPTISPIADHGITEDSTTGPISFTIGDPETPVADLVVAVGSSNPSLVPLSAVTISGASSNRTVTVTPAPNESGVAFVSVSVTDTNGSATTETFALTVDPVNDPPTLAPIDDLTLTANAGPQLISLSGITSGAVNENQPLIISANTDNPALIAALNVEYSSPSSDGALILSLVTNASGIANITVFVSDRQRVNGVFSQSFAITVSPQDTPPTISNIPDLTIDEDTSTGPLAFVVGDIQTSANDLVVSFASSNRDLIERFVVFGGSGSNRTINITPHPNRHGNATLSVVVRDLDGRTAVESFDLTIAPVADPPVISGLRDRVMDEDGTLEVAFTVSDWDEPGPLLSTEALSMSPDLIVTTNLLIQGSGFGRGLLVRPLPDRFGTGTVALTVRDSSGLSVTEMFQVLVNPVNDAPTITPIAAQSIGANTSTPLLPFVVFDVDDVASDLVVTARSSTPSLVGEEGLTLAGTESNRTVMVTPSVDQFGLAVITLAVADVSGATATTGFELLVNQANGPPVIFLHPESQSPISGSTVTLRVVATGPGPLTYQWRHDGIELPGETNSVLTKLNVQPVDNGAYSVLVANAAGSVGSNPAQLRVYVCPTLSISRSGGSVMLSFATVIGQSYTVEYKDSFDGAWTALGSPTAGTGDALIIADGLSATSMRFYRVRAE
jgi:hypothetical protein